MNIYLIVAIVAAAAASSSASRVIDGTNANIANHPYQASLRLLSQHTCGAVLISNTQAITAAHCGGGSLASYSVLAGTTDRTVDVCATCALRNPLTNFIRHADFANNPTLGYPNDIGIAVFFSIATNVNIRYASLATENDGDFAGASCIISGWGRQVSGGQLPTSLQEGSMAVLTNEECAAQWGAGRISPDHLCARGTNNAACGGDNGGPLVCGGLVSGIFSWGDASCTPSLASVFVRVSRYEAWINSNLLAEDEDVDF